MDAVCIRIPDAGLNKSGMVAYVVHMERLADLASCSVVDQYRDSISCQKPVLMIVSRRLENKEKLIK